MRRFQRVRLRRHHTAAELAWEHALSLWQLELAAGVYAADRGPTSRERLREAAYRFVEASDANARLAEKLGRQRQPHDPILPTWEGGAWVDSFDARILRDAKLVVTDTSRGLYCASLYLRRQDRPYCTWPLRFHPSRGWTLGAATKPGATRELERALALRLARWPARSELPRGETS